MTEPFDIRLFVVIFVCAAIFAVVFAILILALCGELADWRSRRRLGKMSKAWLAAHPQPTPETDWERIKGRRVPRAGGV